MSSFKQHFQECVKNGSNIEVDMCHLDSITMEDICMLIEVISVEKLEVILSDDVKNHLYFDLFENLYLIPMLNNHNKEELAILLYLYKKLCYPTRWYKLYTNLTTIAPPNGTEYIMSDSFLICASQCMVDNYLITQHITSTYGIKYKTNPRNQYFIQYMSTGPKSAHAVGRD